MNVKKSSLALAVVLVASIAPAEASVKTAMKKAGLYAVDGVTYPVRRTAVNVAKFLVVQDLKFEEWLIKTAHAIESAEIEEMKEKINEAQPEGEAKKGDS